MFITLSDRKRRQAVELLRFTLDEKAAGLEQLEATGDVAAAPRLLGDVLFLKEDLKGAELAYRRGIERKDALAAAKVAKLLDDRGNSKDALATWRLAEQLGYRPAINNVASILKRLGKRAAAREATTRWVDVIRSDIEAGDKTYARALGNYYHGQGDVEAAKAMWKEADKVRKSQGDSGGYNAGRMDEEWGRIEAAERAFRNAAEHGHRMACHELVRLLERRGDLDAAEQALLAYDKLYGSSLPGDSAEAEYLASVALQRDPLTGSDATYRLGLIEGLHFRLGPGDALDRTPEFDLARTRARAYLMCAAERGHKDAATMLELDTRDIGSRKGHATVSREIKKLLASEAKRLAVARGKTVGH